MSLTESVDLQVAAARPGPKLLAVRGLQVEIHTSAGTVRPVDDVTFSVAAGETVGIVGESGSGKTMTGMSIIRLLPPGGEIVGGGIEFEGRDIAHLGERELRTIRGDRIAMVFQDPMTSLNPTRTIGSQLREAYRIHRPGSTNREAADRAEEVLQLVRMPRPAERLGDYPHQLSGGMRQRAMIALALVCEPSLLIADEPTTALDVSIQSQILDLLDELKKRLGMGVVLVTHDLGVIAGHADRVAVMYGGRIVEEGATDELFRAPRHRYTRALFESMPTLDADTRRPLTSIPGSPPRLIDLAPGCRFAPRCRFADDECRAADPVDVAVSADHRHRCVHPAAPGAASGEAGEPTAETVSHRLPDADGRPLLTLRAVEKRFPLRRLTPFGRRRELHAVSGVSLEVVAGETLGIVGESGSGKTTVGRMIVGLEHPTDGTVSVDGDDIASLPRRTWRQRRRDLQMMFQDSSAALDPKMSVEELIAEPLAAQGIGSASERRERVLTLLEAVGLPADAADRRAHEFSGGQRQRIAMARALIVRPKVIVADEPVSALDVSVQAQILNLMRSLQAEFDLTYVVISHDLSLLRYLADRIAVMYLGKLVEIGRSEAVYTSPRHPYTRGLIASIPHPDPAHARRGQVSTLTGEIPSAIEPPSGCRFRTRCPLATELCAREEPLLQETSTGQAVACHYPLEVQPVA